MVIKKCLRIYGYIFKSGVSLVLLREKSFRFSVDIDIKAIRVVERRSNATDINRPFFIFIFLIYLLNEAVVPLVVSLISNLATPLIQHKKDSRTPTGGIHTKITIKKEDGYSKIKCEGDGETFLKILDSLKNKSGDNESTNN